MENLTCYIKTYPVVVECLCSQFPVNCDETRDGVNGKHSGGQESVALTNAVHYHVLGTCNVAVCRVHREDGAADWFVVVNRVLVVGLVEAWCVEVAVDVDDECGLVLPAWGAAVVHTDQELKTSNGIHAQ